MNGAWLITWEWDGDHAKVDKPLVAVLNHRLGAERVKEFVERFYISSCSSPAEMMAYAANKEENPYPAQFNSVNVKGLGTVQWANQIICGHNPYIFARKVDDLRVEGDDTGQGKPVWNERRRNEPSL